MSRDPITDEIARVAARLLERGEATDVEDAIRQAELIAAAPPGRRPSAGLVRRHLEARGEAALGVEGYRARVDAVLAIASEIMVFLEEELDAGPTRLAGRAAARHVEGDVTLYLRIYTDWPMAGLVDRLVERGYEEPTFETANSRRGRLDRIRFSEAGHEVVLTRCPPDDVTRAGVDLFTGRPIRVATLDDLR